MLSDLPDIPDEFIGRRAELDHLADTLERRRLVTLTGVGGVGKSRLALHAAHAVRADRGREVIWAELWPLRDDRLLTATVAGAAGFADHTAALPLDVLCVWLAGQDAVLVLDSCEHLLSSCRHLAARLLTACPSLTVPATSRAALEVPGELLVTVGPLPAATDGPGRPRDGRPAVRVAGGHSAGAGTGRGPSGTAHDHPRRGRAVLRDPESVLRDLLDGSGRSR
ncbi:hypothetical protein ACFT4A_38725 [Streptomyces sp. NPDC057099]|uniref:hypothetical protein n=1 Tax=Streptomyces sp. NPDC057099 TaxID=3346019 RepID=UPI00362BC8D1